MRPHRAPGFPGQSRTLADLYYNRYRDYDPTTGRYIQADPIGLNGGANVYAYVGGNPVNWVDPMGLERRSKNGTTRVPGTRYDVRIDQPKSGAGERHAHIYDPKGTYILN